MVQRKCPKCDAVFYRKSNYDKHINKVFDCSTNKDNLNDFKEEILTGIEQIQNIPNNSKTISNDSKLIPNNSNQILSVENMDLNELNDMNKSFCCGFCFKIYSTKSNLTKHSKLCKIKKQNDIEKENIFKLLLEKDKKNEDKINQLEQQNKLLMDKIDKLINIKETSKSIKSAKLLKTSKITNNTNNNNQKIINNTQNNNQKITNNIQNNNIVMVNFGKEDLSIIDTKQFIDKVIKKPTITGVKIPDEVLKIIHFNPEYP